MNTGPSEYLFGGGRGRVAPELVKQVDKIVEPLGVTFVAVTLPGEGPRYWFAGPNLGHPFDQALAKDVYAKLDAAGIVLP